MTMMTIMMVKKTMTRRTMSRTTTAQTKIQQEGEVGYDNDDNDDEEEEGQQQTEKMSTQHTMSCFLLLVPLHCPNQKQDFSCCT